MEHDLKHFMTEALALADKGIGKVEPNPAVGAVLVKNGIVIGKGYHKRFGGPHAEVNAIRDCIKKGDSPKGATIYVTLEPCCHHGKTGPCVDIIIESKIKTVVAAMTDPNPQVSGKGIRKLRKAGIEVKTGICRRQAQNLNAAFIKNVTVNMPWVTLKWAQSLDGFLAYKNQGKGNLRKWITNEKSRADVQKLRSRVNGILVGINTVIKDDPLLTLRTGKDSDKLARIIPDPNLRIPLTSRLVTTAKQSPLIIATTKQTAEQKKAKITKLQNAGAEIIFIPAPGGLTNFKSLLKKLWKLGCYHLLVEGGPRVLDSFLKKKLADEVVIYVSDEALGKKGAAPVTANMSLGKALDLENTDVKKFGTDVRFRSRLDSI